MRRPAASAARQRPPGRSVHVGRTARAHGGLRDGGLVQYGGEVVAGEQSLRIVRAESLRLCRLLVAPRTKVNNRAAATRDSGAAHHRPAETLRLRRVAFVRQETCEVEP